MSLSQGSPIESIVRRGVDLFVSSVGIVALSPLLCVVAVWVRLDSPGPVLYSQWRVGLHGRRFRLWKFRTMVQGADRIGPSVTSASDRRRTACGKWLRRLKIDELPQLWNVLRGDMSLVGPRPEVPEWVDYWPEGTATVVLSVRPGMTDPVTLCYRDEEAVLAQADDPVAYYRDVLLTQKAASYVDYVHRRSIVSDLLVLLRTPFAVLSPTRRQTANYSWATCHEPAST